MPVAKLSEAARRRRPDFGTLIAVAGCVAVLSSTQAFSYNEKEDGWPWRVVTPHAPEKQVGGWFYNLGPTGIRAKINKADPQAFTVKYVFEGSPAHGLVKIDDRIVGVNGKPFGKPHGGRPGEEHPLIEFGTAIEESEGTDGKLVLLVKRKGKTEKVTVKIRALGRFSSDYPRNCAKSDFLLKEICELLAESQGRNGAWPAQRNAFHVNNFAPLCLLASGDPKYLPNVKRAVERQIADTKNGGMQWLCSYAMILLSEYYLATGEDFVIPALENLDRFSRSRQYDNGGWGHWGFDPKGGNGYGAFNPTTTLTLLGWSLMERCGVELTRDRYMQAHEFIMRGTNGVGYVWYKDGGAGRGGSSDMGRTASSVLAHFLSISGGEKFADVAARGSKTIAEHPERIPYTHASAMNGALFHVLAMAATNPQGLRRLLDAQKWWINLARCHDGWYYCQPECDHACDYCMGPRILMTSVVGIMLASKHKRLQMTGAGHHIPGFDSRTLSKLTEPPYGLVTQGQYARAQTSLDKAAGGKGITDADSAVIERIQTHINGKVDAVTKRILSVDRAGDVLRAAALIKEQKSVYGGIGRYDAAIGPLEKSMKDEPRRSELRRGRRFYQIVEVLKKVRRGSTLRSLERFAGDNEESPYGEVASAIVAELKADPSAAVDPDRHFTARAEGVEIPAPAAAEKEKAPAGGPVEKVVESAAASGPSEEAVADYRSRLLKRLAEALKEGRAPKFHSVKMRMQMKVTAADESGALSVRGTRMPVTMSVNASTLAPKEARGLALSVLREGNARDHALAAFFLIAAGDTDEAQAHVLMAGEEAEVLRAFSK